MECVTAVRAGLGSIIPLQLLTTLSPLEMELRTCGLPYINLEFLKVGSPSRPAQHSALTIAACALVHMQLLPHPAWIRPGLLTPGPFFPRPTPCTRWG